MMAKKAKKTRDEFVHEWMLKIDKADKYIDKYTTRKKWKDYRSYYRGDWDQAILPVNRVYAFGRMMIPAVYFRAPKVSITAQRPEYVWHARVVEAIDNWLIKELLLKETLKNGALDSFLAGTSPIKIGYDSEFGYLPEQAVDENSGTATQLGRKDGERIEYRENVKEGMPWALTCAPEDIIVPPGYRTASSLPWICHRVYRPLEDVQQDQKYKNTAELSGTKMVNLQRQEQRNFGRGEGDETKFVELYEVRDVRTRQILVFCEDTLILGDRDAVAIEGLPYEFITFNPDPEIFWGIPDVKIMEAQQLELNEVKTQEQKHRQIALLKFLYKKGALTKENLNHFLSGTVGPGVEITDENLQTAIMMMQPHVPPDFGVLEKRIDENMRQSLGFSANQMGDFSGYHGKTAAESMIVNQSNELRNNERKDIIGDVLVNIIRKWNQLIFSYWDKEKVIEIVGPKGQAFWVEYTGDQLRGEYFIGMDPESGMPMTRGMKMQMSQDLMKAFNGDQLIDQIRLRQMVLRNHEWHEADASSLLLQGPQGMAQDMAGQRQPGPMYGGGSGGGGSRPNSGPGPGGGAGASPGAPGSGVQNPMALEQMMKKMPGGR
jgi:hypothetical protein